MSECARSATDQVPGDDPRVELLKMIIIIIIKHRAQDNNNKVTGSRVNLQAKLIMFTLKMWPFDRRKKTSKNIGKKKKEKATKFTSNPPSPIVVSFTIPIHYRSDILMSLFR